MTTDGNGHDDEVLLPYNIVKDIFAVFLDAKYHWYFWDILPSGPFEVPSTFCSA